MQESNNNMPTSTDSNQPSSHHRTMAMLMYILGIFFPILAPLIIWALMKDEGEFINKCGKEALNFHISFTIYSCICSILVFIIIGIPLLLAIMLTAFVLNIIAGVKAYEGEIYRVPLIIRFIT